MAAKANKAFTKEEELLLQDFSRNVSTKSSALFYGNAFIVSVIPICEYLLRISYYISDATVSYLSYTKVHTYLVS